jgi:hypothetical protein
MGDVELIRGIVNCASAPQEAQLFVHILFTSAYKNCGALIRDVYAIDMEGKSGGAWAARTPDHLIKSQKYGF